MTTDEMCLSAIQRGVVIVDAEAGTATTVRFHGKRLGSRNHEGYMIATLHLDGQRKQIKLHRLIWIAVNGLPSRGMVIDHINRQKSDNRILNLRLVHNHDNARNRRRYIGEANPAAKINATIATQIRDFHRVIGSSRKVATAFGVSQSLVCQILRGERWAN